MKCPVCQYEKLGNKSERLPDEVIHYKSGKKKGQVRKIVPGRLIVVDQDPEKKNFKEFHVDIVPRFLDPEDSTVTLYACPNCKSIRVHEYTNFDEPDRY